MPLYNVEWAHPLLGMDPGETEKESRPGNRQLEAASAGIVAVRREKAG